MAPNQETYNFINHAYLAGSYRLEVSVSADNGRGELKDFFFDISTAQELYSKQQADYARRQADYAKEQAETARDALTATWNSILVSFTSTALIALIGLFTMIATLIQAANSREQARLARLEIMERLRPQFELAESSAMIRSSHQTIQFKGKLRNVGQVAARNIIAQSATVTNDQLNAILSERTRVLQAPSTRIGTLLPSGEYEYIFDKPGTQSQYAVVWISYTFLRDRQEEAILWLNLVGGSSPVNHRWWTDEDIHPERYSENRTGLTFIQAIRRIPSLLRHEPL